MHQPTLLCAAGATLDSGERERLSRDAIPEDLRCTLCDAQPTFRNAAGYQGHMAAKHGVHFEQSTLNSDNPEIARLAALRHAGETPQEPSELPVWAKVAIVKHEMFGESWATCAEQMGKSADTLRAYMKTPAGRKAVTQVHEMSDMKSLIKLMMDSATAHMYADWLMALEWAKGARDFKMVHTMMKDIGLQPILQDAKQQTNVPQTLILNLGINDLKAIPAETTSHIIEADVVIEDEY